MNQFKNWVHWFAGIVFTAALTYASNDAVQKAVNKALGPHVGLVAILGAIGAAAVAYSSPKKITQ